MCFVFFFFQAEDGIRDLTVTGVQTCALPICRSTAWRPGDEDRGRRRRHVDAWRSDPVSRAGRGRWPSRGGRSEEHTSELQSQSNLVCRLLLEKKKKKNEVLREVADWSASGSR